MKTIITIISCLVFTGSCYAAAPVVPDATLRTEIKEYDKPGVGKVKVETTYRGKERILEVMSFPKATSRFYYLHGKQMFIESDDNGDGFYENLMVPGDSMSDFEQFIRKKDGTVEPISKEKYLELKKKITDIGF